MPRRAALVRFSILRRRVIPASRPLGHASHKRPQVLNRIVKPASRVTSTHQAILLERRAAVVALCPDFAVAKAGVGAVVWARRLPLYYPESFVSVHAFPRFATSVA
jgi:hypothetical protein